MGHDQSGGRCREVVWWAPATGGGLINKLKGVKPSSGKCKKLRNCMLSPSCGTWTYPRATLDWEGNMAWYTQSRPLLEGVKGNYSRKEHGNRERFLHNNRRSFFKKSKKEDLGSSSLVSLTAEPS